MEEDTGYISFIESIWPTVYIMLCISAAINTANQGVLPGFCFCIVHFLAI